MWSVKEKYMKRLKEKNKVISPHVVITPNIPPVSIKISDSLINN